MDQPEPSYGEYVDHEQPDWGPLERCLPLLLCGPFMWMGAIELINGPRVATYKHKETRRYLCLDDDAEPYGCDGYGRYGRIRHHDAIEHAFDTSWVVQKATPEELDALREVLSDCYRRTTADHERGLYLWPVASFRPLLPAYEIV